MSEAIDVVLPVHNEAESIGGTLREFYQIVAVENLIPIRFVVCEDGSRDKTVEVLKKLAGSLPIHLISDDVRKGYSRAVVDGFRVATSGLVGFIDSDGQCDPRDFSSFVAAQQGGEYDLIFGYRNPRHDHWIRMLMSNSFGAVYRCFFSIPLRDPSCPFLLIRQEALQLALRGNPGVLEQGFWWEFVARCMAARLRIKELPVAHRARTAGRTQVYRPSKVPGIAYKHLCGLLKLKMELRGLIGNTARRFQKCEH
jgi:glycosyltransferase involved in cell wall biosynthesis